MLVAVARTARPYISSWMHGAQKGKMGTFGGEDPVFWHMRQIRYFGTLIISSGEWQCSVFSDPKAMLVWSHWLLQFGSLGFWRTR